MRGLPKSKRVAWAPDANLCQIRLFLSEESPLQVGLGIQDHLQAKISSVPHLNGEAVNDFLPPGFEGPHSKNHLQINLSDIPVIKWRCPLRFVLDLKWQVVAGEESKEVVVQNLREPRVLEAVYPRPSAIPTNPLSADIENCHYDDRETPQVPITPIEDEDAATETLCDALAPFGASISSKPQLLPPGTSPHLHCSMPSASTNEKPVAGMFHNGEPVVASAAFTAINQSNDPGNMIDPGLLVKILSNPKLIEKLVTDYGAASSVGQNLPISTSPLVLPFDPPPAANLSDPFTAHISRTENGAASVAAASGGVFYSEPNGVGVGLSNKQGSVPAVHPVAPSPAMGLTQEKDVNYYKNLIQQHGGEKQEQGLAQKFNSSRYNQQLRPNQELINNPKSRDSKPRIMKPCMYFNSSKGCRNGANCAFQHDASSQNRGKSVAYTHNSKRMKMDGDISS
ncbi:hypothetical protein V6N13_118190 [Hibiscus sabdariffa]|uniref:C3H1-type domain-containing protein n=1 Tax=Hibiscus sabdariffa TaxID=183260 RepID=A0ABR2Q8Z0_9ROSI